MRIDTQFSIFLINKPGVLAAVSEALADARINMLALTLMDTGEHGVLRIITDNPSATRTVLGSAHDRWTETEVLVLEMDKAISQRPRLRLVEARAALELDQFDRVEAILMDVELTDIREGEFGLTDLWFSLCEKRIAKTEGVVIDDALRQRVRAECPPPEKIDFRSWVTPPPSSKT